MRSFAGNAMNVYEHLANDLQEFLFNGKSPTEENKVEHTKEELLAKLEEIRIDMWEEYNNGKSELGWK